MTEWNELHAELDRWGKAGLTATLWCRDDDARTSTRSLARLLDLVGENAIPLALSVVPVSADDSLVQLLDSYLPVTLFQHGYAHQDHAAPGDPKSEFGRTRPFPVALGEMATGWQRLESLFGNRVMPVMVPPWNRIAAPLVPMLPEIGYAGLSTWKPRTRAHPVQGLAQVNTHVDIIEWRGSRRFIGEKKALGGLIRHLEGRRTGKFDFDEPTGLLTHHLEHDADCWGFLTRLFRELSGQSAASWVSPNGLFSGQRDAAA